MIKVRGICLLVAVGLSCQPQLPQNNDLQLKAGRAAQTSKLGAALPDPQTLFVSLELTLINHTSNPAPLDAPLFLLTTTDGLQVSGDAATANHPRGCQQNASVAAGATVTCVTVFRLAPSATPATLLYQRGDAASASASVTDFARCVICGSDCIDVSGDAANCGSCGATVGLGSCAGGKPSCNKGANLCGTSCVDLKSDPANCGKCGTKVGSDMNCAKGQVVCSQADLIVCGAACVSPADPASCGGCTPCAGLCVCDSSQSSSCVYQCVPTCDIVCGSLACTSSTTYYRCTQTSSFAFDKQACSPPPAIQTDPGSGLSCSLSAIECHCT